MTAPDELLRFVASVVRTARRARKWSQAKLAAEAGVSLAHVGLLEKGRNVSLVFLSKVANALHLTLSLSDAAAPSSSADRVDYFELIRRLDLLATLVADLRTLATTAVVPSSSEHGRLKETLDVAAFIDRVLKDDAGIQRLTDAMNNFSTEARPRVPSRAKAPALTAPRAKRARSGSAGSGK